ncbi:NAD(+)/NADH kinase [Capillimicrobium parvum]|uniref:NAD kinase n=1 Tax=Capillimicrobium parvum TaxID=2884022 RepID=A0A9E7C1Z5_9ACTN|nr:NAD(+)/NADH kinase [Capillimicrobium parvum]UGS37107.1 NAD kinase [Capillimicrobium parvum]
MAERVAVVMTHRRAEEIREAVDTLERVAAEHDVTLRFVDDEPEGDDEGVEIAIALGGDGTILSALRRFSGSGVPVFAVNYGQVGFLATIEASDCQRGFARAFSQDFELLHLPGVGIAAPGIRQAGLNDVSITRRPGDRVAVLAYVLGGEELGRVRCDGLVVSTPAGSTGYNLANGGPVLAWGVGGYVVSFIAPHSLTARALVVAPADTLTICNRSSAESVDVSVDGRPVGELAPADSLDCSFVGDAALLAQLPGTTFYRRLREKFGHLV